MSEQLYTQCKLSKNNIIQITWLPSEFAVVGRIVKLKETGDWDDGWKVDEAYLTAHRTHEEVRERSQDYKRTRKASDI